MSDSAARDQAIQHLRRLEAEGVWGVRRSEPAKQEVKLATNDSDLQTFSSPTAGGQSPSGESLTLETLAAAARDCQLCRLCEERTNVVWGVGNPDARLMFIGEGPGRDEDIQGEPFVGAAGRLLNKIIEAMGLRREDVYIANTVKCRPPHNRNPAEDELAACRPYLMQQVDLVSPEMIVVLGRVAMQAILATDAPLGRMRGRVHEWNGIPVICTYHPAYLLRTPEDKGKTWADMQAVMQQLGIGQQ